jgi:hypothetical protein
MKTLAVLILMAAAAQSQEKIVLFTTSKSGVTRVARFDDPKHGMVNVEVLKDGDRTVEVLDSNFKEAQASWSKQGGDVFKGQLVLVKKTAGRRVYGLLFYKDSPETHVKDYLTIMQYVSLHGLDQ